MPTLARCPTGTSVSEAKSAEKAFSALFASDTLVQVGHQRSLGKVGRPGELYRFDGPVTGTRTRELPWDVVRARGQIRA